MAFLTGQTEEQHRPQVADQLHLGAGGFQRQDVILIEDRHGFQGVVVPGVLAGPSIGHDVQPDFHHAGLSRQILCLGRHTVEGIAHRDRPRKLLEGLCGFALEVEGPGQGLFVQPEGGHATVPGRHRAVGQVDDLIVIAVVCQRSNAVGTVTLHHTAVGEIAVVVRHGVVGLVIGGGHTVPDGGRRDGA